MRGWITGFFPSPLPEARGQSIHPGVSLALLTSPEGLIHRRSPMPNAYP